MSEFAGMNNAGLEETRDNLGGGFVLDTNIYTGKVKMAYAGKAASGARFIHWEFEFDGKSYREDTYFTNAKGENFFLNKQDNTKKVGLPGFVTVDEICLVTTGYPLENQKTEEKMVNQWDKDQRKELPKAANVLIDVIGKEVSLGIRKNLENKSEKDEATGKYVDTADTRDTNNIDKVFHTESKRTVVEIRNKLETGEFWDKWLERNKDQVTDKRSIKDGAATSGRPGAGGKAAPQAGAEPRKSLFG